MTSPILSLPRVPTQSHLICEHKLTYTQKWFIMSNKKILSLRKFQELCATSRRPSPNTFFIPQEKKIQTLFGWQGKVTCMTTEGSQSYQTPVPGLPLPWPGLPCGFPLQRVGVVGPWRARLGKFELRQKK